MNLEIKNSISGKKEEFKPIKKNKVGMYHCGPTVYDRAHLGNLRPYIFADLMRRYFEYYNFKVKQVINITDVGHLISDSDEGEDKIEQAIKNHNTTAKEITKKYTDLFFQDISLLNIDKSKIKFPRATHYIKEQIKLIKKLESKKLVYRIDDGVYFDTSLFPEYGQLGKIDIENLQEGARVEFNSQKKNKTDFALWKFSKPNENRQQEWKSPWGIGFPGWHLECSAMSRKLLGQPFDIHTGGIDHLTIHHNNEIAQSESAYDKKQANYWMHVNHIMLNNQKISKSLGNVLYIDDLKSKNILPSSFRYWTYTADYSSQLNLTDESLKSADTAFRKILHFVNSNLEIIQNHNLNEKNYLDQANKKYMKLISEDLSDDFNTSKSIANIWELIKDPDINIIGKISTLLEVDKILGLNIYNLAKEIQNKEQAVIPDEILEIAEERQIARKNKDFKKSDELRDLILSKGFKIMDKGDDFEITIG